MVHLTSLLTKSRSDRIDQIGENGIWKNEDPPGGSLHQPFSEVPFDQLGEARATNRDWYVSYGTVIIFQREPPRLSLASHRFFDGVQVQSRVGQWRWGPLAPVHFGNDSIHDLRGSTSIENAMGARETDAGVIYAIVCRCGEVNNVPAGQRIIRGFPSAALPWRGSMEEDGLR